MNNPWRKAVIDRNWKDAPLFASLIVNDNRLLVEVHERGSRSATRIATYVCLISVLNEGASAAARAPGLTAHVDRNFWRHDVSGK